MCTKKIGLWHKWEGNFEVRVYTHVDWDGNIGDKKSTSGRSSFLGERLIIWLRKKQSIISQSKYEAEYIDATLNYSNIF